MHITIVGCGYVGLVTGVCFAEKGHSVTCIDIDEEKIKMLKQGKSPIYEPGLEPLIQRNTKANRLTFTTSYSEGFENAKVCFLAVPTQKSADGSADLTHVLSSSESIAEVMQKPLIIANKCTVPVGTADVIRDTIAKHLKLRAATIAFDVVSSPEFLKEGNALQDCLYPERIVIGSDSEESFLVMKGLYDSFDLEENHILHMDIRSAEMTKYAANTMLASRISLMNEFSQLCEHYKADIEQVALGIGTDSRIGKKFLRAGIGFGGSCFPKDVEALKFMGKEANLEMPITEGILTINQKQQYRFCEKIESTLGNLQNKTIALWGLSFKPETDDIREAPAISIIDFLLKKGANIQAYDPIAISKMQAFLGPRENLSYCSTPYETTTQADVIVLATEWKEFLELDFAKLLSLMHGPYFFDGRNQFDNRQMEKYGFSYIRIGCDNEPTSTYISKDLSQPCI